MGVTAPEAQRSQPSWSRLPLTRSAAVIPHYVVSSSCDGATLARRTLSVATWLCCVAVVTQWPRRIDAQSVHGSAYVHDAAGNTATIQGVALDSLHEVPWSGAAIVIQDLTIPHADTINADDNGHFQVRATGGHLYRLSAADSLTNAHGLQVTATLRARSDSATHVVLALPSGTSITRLVCGSSKVNTGTLAGRVTSTYRGVDFRDATIEVSWIATQIDVVMHRVTSVPQLAMAQPDKEGHFVICGLPVPLQARLVAQVGSDSAIQSFTLAANQGFATATVALPSTSTDVAGTSGQRPEPVDKTGQTQSHAHHTPPAITVLTTAGTPVPEAEVTLDDRDEHFLTDTNGVVRTLPHSTRVHRISIRKLGFAPVDVMSSLATDSQGIMVHLREAPSVLQKVVITGERNRASADFAFRARTGIGHYITEADIARQNPSCFLDVLKRLPGLQVKKSSGCAGGVSVFRGQGTIMGDPAANGCVRLIVDGGSVSGYDAVNVDDILGVEVYDETTAPLRYRTQCAAIVVWTKEAQTIY